MSLFNRIVVILLAVGILGLALAAWLLPWLVVATLERGASTLRTVPQEVSFFVAGRVGAAVALVVLVLELWPHPSPRVFRVHIEGGTLQYPADAVVNLLERELAQVDGIRQAKVSVRDRRGKLDLRAWAATAEGADPRAVATTSAGRVRDKLERGMGLSVHDVAFSIQPGESAAAARERGRLQPLRTPTASSTASPTSGSV